MSERSFPQPEIASALTVGLVGESVQVNSASPVFASSVCDCRRGVWSLVPVGLRAAFLLWYSVYQGTEMGRANASTSELSLRG